VPRRPDWTESPEGLALLQQQGRQDLLAATEPLLALQQPFRGLHAGLLQLWYVERAAQVRGRELFLGGCCRCRALPHPLPLPRLVCTSAP
jgi:hypothetical protein